MIAGRQRRSVAFWVLTLTCLTVSGASQTSADDPGWQKYRYLLQANTLAWLSSQPFLLKFDYQLYDLDGNPSVKGTAEQAWGDSTAGNFVHIHSSSLDQKEPDTSEEAIRTHTRESYLVHQLLHSIVSPLPMEKRTDFVMDQFQQGFESSTLDCFALTPPRTHTPSTQAYCTDADNHLTVTMGQGAAILTRSNFRKSRDHEAPVDVVLAYDGRIAIKAHVTELDILQPAPVQSAAQAERGAERVPSGVLAGAILKKQTPAYPKQARKKHVTGSVLLTAIITKEGTIAGLDVVASPDPLFSKSAMDAVQQWIYKPYLLNGQPTEVDTTISVNYKLGR